MDASDVEVQEDRHLSGVWHGDHVRIRTPSSCYTAADDVVKSKHLYRHSFPHIRYRSPRLYRRLLQHGQRQHLEQPGTLSRHYQRLPPRPSTSVSQNVWYKCSRLDASLCIDCQLHQNDNSLVLLALQNRHSGRHESTMAAILYTE